MTFSVDLQAGDPERPAQVRFRFSRRVLTGWDLLQTHLATDPVAGGSFTPNRGSRSPRRRWAAVLTKMRRWSITSRRSAPGSRSPRWQPL